MSTQSFAAMDKLSDDIVSNAGVELRVLRLDNFFPLMSGNKFFKLKYNIEFAKANGFKQLLSFGGAYSNHIHALAMAGRYHQMDTIGMIRGEPVEPLNATLQDAVNAGMTLHYLSRKEYRSKQESGFMLSLQQRFPDAFIIPEGGSNLLGVQGCAEIVEHVSHHLSEDYDVLIVPCGTAATLAGVSAALPKDKRVVGFSVLKNANYLDDEVRGYHKQLQIPEQNNWHVEHSYHCGGYAKLNKELADFIAWFQSANDLNIEPVYTGKMFYGLYQLLNNNSSAEANNKASIAEAFKPGARIVAIHTGGLQGLRGMAPKLDKLTSNVLAG